MEQSDMAQALRRAGYRLTRPRQAVLQVLEENDVSLTPQEVYRRGRAIYPQLGLVTVYRTLDLLATLGLARRVHSGRHCQDYVSAGAGRHHLLCQKCRRVVEFPCSGLGDLIEQVQQRTGYAITDHLLELSGLCPDCQAREEQDDQVS